METRVPTLSTVLMGNQSDLRPFKECTQCKKKTHKKINEYPPIKYNNKYLNMTSICAKTQIRLNEKTFLKHCYIRYTTTY